VTLYILEAIPSGLFKIGITDQFDRRLSAIRRQNSEQVLVVSTYHGESDYIRELEKGLHAELKPVRWQCEWYYGGVRHIVPRERRLCGQAAGSSIGSCDCCPGYQFPSNCNRKSGFVRGRQQFRHRSVRLVDGFVGISVCAGVGVCDRDATEWLPSDHPGLFPFRPVGIEE
jgi:Meiotically up-regulated gene 113